MKHFFPVCVTALPLLVSASSPVEFNRDVRPILADACFHCHGPDPGTRKAGLRLDTEAGFFTAREGEQPTVVKGAPDKSELFLRLVTDVEDDLMPPAESHKTLEPEQIALIRRWIVEGAPWQAHWSFVLPARPEPPAVQGTGWPKNEIDRFVLAKLENLGLEPAPEADARTLIRRLSLDVTGLPPSLDRLERFASRAVEGKLPDSVVAELVDELLALPAYGEHRARYWLDAARYGDTHGLHFDNYREMWPYRDWTVAAFNANQPFDSFTVEQIAGDLLPTPTVSQLIATGFQRCNITTNEGGTIDEENLANYAADRVQTLGWVYLGLTTNCAQCHDHKFDPISAKDFYSLAAFFRNTTQGAKDGNSKDGRGPVLVLPAAEDQPRWDALPQEIELAQAKRATRRKDAVKDFDAWLVAATPEHLDQDLPAKGLVVHLPLNEGTGNEVANVCGGTNRPKVTATGPISWTPGGKLGPAAVLQTGSTFDLGDLGNFDSSQPFSYGAWVKAGRNGVYGAILARVDQADGYRGWDLWQNDRTLSVHLIEQWPDSAIKVSTRDAVLRPGQWQHVFVTYDGSGKAGGIKIHVDGAEQRLAVNTATLRTPSTIRSATSLRVGQRSEGQVFEGGSVQDVRVYEGNLSAADVKRIADVGPLRAILAAASDERTPQQREALFTHFLVTRDPAFQEFEAKTRALEGEKESIKARSPIAHVQEEVKNVAPMASILMRGQYDKVGDRVDAAIPAALGTFPEDAPKNRLGLARWLVAERNPLTARVTVNRFWQEVFGRGLVVTAEDFGIMGTPPTHPELLDWLAVEFRESGWDVKGFYRRVLTSATYRQAAVITPNKLEKDRDNLWLSRGPRFRMDAEMVRDYALAASGLMSPKMGGPGVKPFQPEGIWDIVGLAGGDTRNYVQDKGENNYRRTLYQFWKRMAPPPNLEAFNAPSREVCVVRRDRTNTPLQALVTMNDPQFVEAARHLATLAVRQEGTDDSKTMDFLFRRVLARPAEAPELEILGQVLSDLRAHFAADEAGAAALLAVGEAPVDDALSKPDLAVWTLVANQLLNLDEVLNK